MMILEIGLKIAGLWILDALVVNTIMDTVYRVIYDHRLGDLSTLAVSVQRTLTRATLKTHKIPARWHWIIKYIGWPWWVFFQCRMFYQTVCDIEDE